MLPMSSGFQIVAAFRTALIWIMCVKRMVMYLLVIIRLSCSNPLQSFKPSLPQEVIVDFSIHRGELVRRATQPHFGLK